MNNYLAKTFNLDLEISYLILVLSIYIIINEISKLKFLMGIRLFNSFILFLGLFLFISVVVSLSLNQTEEAIFSLRSHIPSLIVFIASSLVILRLYLDFGINRNLLIIRNILLINSFAICAGYIFEMDLFRYEGGRTGGFLLNANQAGYTACLLLVIQLYLMKNKRNITSIVILSITILSLFLSFSRAALAGVVVILCYYLYKNFSWRKAFKPRNFALILSGMIVFYLIYNTFISAIFGENQERIERIGLLFEGEFTDETSSNRASLFRAAFYEIENNYLFGVGARGMSRLHGIDLGVHNQYLLILGEGGLISLVLYLLFLGFLWTSSKRLYKDERWLVRGLFLSMIVFMMATHNMLNNKTLLLIFPLLIVTITYSKLCAVSSEH